jgi:MFS family permease
MVAVLGLAYFFVQFHRQSLAVIAGRVASDLVLDSAGLGALGAAAMYSYALMQVPVGFLTDRFGARRTVTASLVVASAGTFAFSAARTAPGAILGRTIMGVGIAAVYIPSLAVLRQWCSRERFATLTGVMLDMGYAGALCATTPLSYLATTYGWRGTHLITGVVTLILAAAAWYLVVDRTFPAELGGRDGAADSEDYRRRAVLRPAFLSLVLWFFLFNGVKLSFQGLWAGQFLTGAYGFSPRQAAAILTSLVVGNIAGAPLLGGLSDRLGGTAAITGGTLVAAAFWAFLGFSGVTLGFAASCAFFFLMGMSEGCLSAAFGQVRHLSPPGKSGMYLGIANTAAFLGSATFTQGIGRVVESRAISGFARVCRPLFASFSAVMALAAAAVWLTNPRTGPMTRGVFTVSAGESPPSEDRR